MGQRRSPSWWNLAPLVAGAFVVAVEGTVLTGVLPQLSRDLATSVSATGQALATYPLGYVVGAPLLAVFVGGRSQRNVCAAGLLIFAVGNLVSASSGSLVTLMAGRLISALGACVFIPNASARAVALGTRRRGRALSVMASGFTAATLVGAPLGVYTAALVGWRAVLVVVAAAAVLACLAQRLGSLGDNQVSGMTTRARLRFLGDRRLLSILVLTVVVVGGEFVVYAYISPLVDHQLVVADGTIATAIMLFGAGSTAGTLLGGFLVDRFGWSRVLTVSVVAIGTTLLVLPLAHNLVFLCACLMTWGLFGWTFTPAQSNRLLAVLPDNGAMVLTLNSSAVQLGVAGGGLLGGVAIDLWSPAVLPFVGAGLVWVSFVAVVASRRGAGVVTGDGPPPCRD
ncbi:hypothetical protein AOZ06_17985 [Kibdelosporangium phytohabitans]|uniref:Major facilitator superfamily (MFS) profile domain-containing protein n=1 Tax=Kibdelosporangium phytohabitans TaxID=860235 RepID=A0A0N9HNL8_9PSEU|nr:hypothetical protein AOZ06_17985 [Kibdelosporangium phytohabitans]